MAGQTKLMLPSGGSVSISASDSTQNTTVTLPGGDVTLATTSQVMGRNRIINGAMMIDQRNAGASVTPANQQYTLDRWVFSIGQASKLSTQRSTTVPAGFSNSLLITSLSSYSVTASDNFNLAQRIEGYNVADLSWGTADAKTVTLSFWVRCSLTGTFGGSIINNAGARSYPFVYSISSANTWTQISVTIPGDTSGTWTTDNTSGIQLLFGLGVGSTYSGTAGSWSSNLYLSATGATSVVGTNGATFYITGVQLEKATTATPFEFRPYGQELALCQRYYQYDSNDGNGYVHLFPSCYAAATYGYAVKIFPVTMRTAPTTTFSAGNTFLADGATSLTPSSITNPGYTTNRTCRMQVNFSSGGSAGQGFVLAGGGSGTALITYSAEL